MIKSEIKKLLHNFPITSRGNTKVNQNDKLEGLDRSDYEQSIKIIDG